MADVSDEWVEVAEARLAEALDEAEELRFTGSLPTPVSGAEAVLDALVAVRANLDRVEGIYTDLVRFRTGIRVVWKAATSEVDDKWADRVANKTSGKRAAFSGGDIEGPRERYAQADLSVLPQRINARKREQVMDAVNDAVHVLDQIKRGLEGVRMDLHSVMRLMTAPEHRLDRSASA